MKLIWDLGSKKGNKKRKTMPMERNVVLCFLIDINLCYSITKTAACGFETGMTIVANPEPNDYHAAIIGAYGVKVNWLILFLLIYIISKITLI